MNIEDNTGNAVSDRDIEDAIGAVSFAMVKLIQIVQLGLPALATNLPNILRCLNELRALRQISEPSAPREQSVPMSRADLVGIAQKLVDQRLAAGLPKDGRAVAIVTDAFGEWVGVASNSDTADVRVILISALTGAEVRMHDGPGPI